MTPPAASRAHRPHPEPATTLLTVPQVAGRLALSNDKVWRLVWAGDIYSVKLGRSRRIPEVAVDDYLARQMDGDQ